MATIVEFDNRGIPLMALGSGVAIETKDVKNEAPNRDDVSPKLEPSSDLDTESVGSYKYIPWYGNNSFPNDCEEKISTNPVLGRALKMHAQIVCGQGIMPVVVTGFDNTGNETFDVVSDPELVILLNKPWVRKYLFETAFSMSKFGNAFIQFRPDISGGKIMKLNATNALYCRLEEPKNGVPEGLLYSGKFPDNDEKYTKRYPLLNYYDAEEQLELLKETGGIAGNTFLYHVKNAFSNNPHYSKPDWFMAEKWVNISNKIARKIDAGLDNVLNIAILIRIPYVYWEKKYPEEEYTDFNKRKEKIEADIQTIIDEFTSVENARKTLIAPFGDNESDADADKWEIEVKELKFNKEDVTNSTAADTQIALAANLHPDMMGLMYGNSKGGSMQRELLLLLYALSWQERQAILDPLEMMLRYNFGTKYEDVELRFRQTFLTTLDSGSGTGQNLSE